ncbi:MAG: Dabb family protein [Candidatus Scalindua sp.]|nr:Dabb family protein [Candidatus Scalindua sp.]
MNIKFLHIIIVVSLLLPACQQDEDHLGQISKVHHVVVCWLNESGNKEARQKVIEVSRGFSAIPGIIDVRAGRVIHSEREIVDNSFDVAIYLSFENEQRLFEYLNHPIHKKAVEKTLKPLVRKVVVYDFIE